MNNIENTQPRETAEGGEKNIEELLLHITSGRENIHKELRALPEETQKRLTERVFAELQPLRSREIPKEFLARLDYFNYTKLKRLSEALRVIDPETYERENIATLLLARLASSLRYDAFNDRETYPSDPRERLEYILAKISGGVSTMEDATSNEEQAIIEKTLAEFDRELARLHREILPYVQATLKDYEERSRRRFEPSRALFDVVEALRRVQEVPLVREGDYYLYNYGTPENGHRRWRIEIFGRSDQSPDNFIVVVRCVGQNDLFFALERDAFIEALENGRLPALVEGTLKNRRLEEENRHTEEAYDLPRDRPIAHLRVFPRTSDFITNRDARTACLSAAVLQSTYQNLRSYPILFTDDPNRDLRNRLREIRQDRTRGTRHVLIDIVSHGSRDQFLFRQPMTATDLVSIVREFPEFTFTFQSDACFTAGVERLRDNPELLADPALQRAAFFFSSKGDVPHIASPDVSGHIGSAREFHFMEALLSNRNSTFGRAAYRAKTRMRNILPNNGGAIIRGTYIGALSPTERQYEALENGQEYFAV